MPSKKANALSGALLGAAATALTVKSALSGPIGIAAQDPLNSMLEKAEGQLNQAVTTAATARLSAPPGSLPGTGRTPSPGPQSKPATSAAAVAPAISDEAPFRADRRYSRPLLRRILHEAALRHRLDPKLVLALSYWESGWDQSRVSSTGAVGLMQVQPEVAAEAGPNLLGRPVDLTNPYDNADLGAAIFRENLDHFGNPSMALAAYYQGPTSVQRDGLLSDTEQYVEGILDLSARMPER